MKKKWIFALVMCLLFVTFFFSGCDPDVTDKPCVVMLGDSIFALSDQETMFLENLSGDSYRQYYISGAQMVGGSVKTIPEQYEDAIADGPIRTVIFDGGGNDILIGANKICSADYGSELSDTCYDVMEEVLQETARWFNQMIADGVQHIVFQGYYYVRNEQLWQVTDVLQEKAFEQINALAGEFPDIKFVYLDPRPYFEQGDTRHLKIDGIHPTRAASRTLANLLWEVMVANDVEQGEPCP